jgi:selenocysteine lyase/cysteine desulfurase
MFNGGDKTQFFELTERTRARFARLINAQPDEIAYAKNVSEGLNMVATGFDWKPGDNVVVCAELEHPNNVYCWLNLQRFGVEVRMVPERDGHINVDDMAARIDARTRVVTASTVTFAPGFRTDIDRLGRVCRERGVFFLVDAAQSAGILQTDVVRSAIDGLAVSTQKGMLGLYGMGFLYCAREWAERMRPAYLARFGVDLGGDVHEAALGNTEFRLMPGARRFDLGNYNFVATAAVDASMALLDEYGVPQIERYVVALARKLAQGFIDLGLPVAGGASGDHLAHLVLVGEMGTGTHYATGDDRFNRLYQYLIDNKVKLSIRRGMLRLSLHLYNTDADVERVLELTRAWQKL